MPILGSSNSTANKDIMSKILTNGDTIFWCVENIVGREEIARYKQQAISSFPTMFSKAVCGWCIKMNIYGIKVKKTKQLISF